MQRLRLIKTLGNNGLGMVIKLLARTIVRQTLWVEKAHDNNNIGIDIDVVPLPIGLFHDYSSERHI